MRFRSTFLTTVSCALLLSSIVLFLSSPHLVFVNGSSMSAPVIPNSIEQVGTSIILTTSTIRMTINNNTGSISKIDNLLTGQSTLLNSTLPLWDVSYNGLGLIGSFANKFSYLINPTYPSLVMFWSLAVQKIAVEVQMNPDPQNGGIDMKIDVQNFNANATIDSVRFPYLSGMTGLAQTNNDTIAIPRLDGLLIPDFQKILGGGQTLQFNYPGAMSMQFLLIYDNGVGGLYFAAQDPGSNFKTFEISNKPEVSFNLDWINYPSEIEPGNQYAMNYSMCLAGFQGQSWEDGSLIYQSWATKQWYVEKGPVATRTDIPSWFKQIGFIWRGTPTIVNGSPSNNLMPSLASSIGEMNPNESFLIDWWGWNHYGFDHGYPEYYPPIDGENALKSAINATHNLGGKVMLYFSGRLVDTNTTIFSDNQDQMIVGPNGEIHTESFGTGLTAAVPDPTSMWWQSEVVNFTTTAVKDYHVDGIYLDAVARASPILNYRNASNVGLSGSQWWMAFAKIMQEVIGNASIYNPNVVTTSEGVSEVYIPYLSGFWDNFDQDNSSLTGIVGSVQIPMFSFVYHEYALVYGEPFTYLYPNLYRYELAKLTSYGLIISPDIPSYIPIQQNDSLFTSKLISMETQYLPFLRYGAELPVSYTTSENLSLSFTNSNDLTSPSVFAGLYKSSNGSQLLLLINPTNSSQLAQIHFYESKFFSQNIESVKACSAITPNCVYANSSGDLQFTVPGLGFTVETIFVSFAIHTTSITSSSSTSTGVGNHSSSTVYFISIVVAVASVLAVTYGVFRFKSSHRNSRTYR